MVAVKISVKIFAQSNRPTVSSPSSDIKEGNVLLPIEGSTLGWSSRSHTPMSPVFITTIKIGSFLPKVMVATVNYLFITTIRLDLFLKLMVSMVNYDWR